VPSFNCSAAPLCASRATPAPRRRLPGLVLASPRLAAPHWHPPELPSAAARRHFSPTGATSCSWQSPRVSPRSTAALALPAVFSRTRHAAPVTVRAPPATATLAVGHQHQLSLTVPSLQLEAHPGAPNTLLLMLPHPHSHGQFFYRPPRLTGPPPQLLPAVVSRPHRLRSPIQCQ
jgi:hypothetical protein